MKKNTIAIVGIIVVVFLAICGVFGIKTVQENEVAISITLGNVNGVRSSGVHFELPFVTTYKTIKINQQKVDTSHNVSTRDMQTISVEIATQYVVDVSKVEELYLKFLGNHEISIIKPTISEVVQSAISKYTIEEFVSERTEISELIETTLKDRLAVYGISIVSVDIIDHDFSDAYEAAVEAKKVAEQQVAQAEFERQQAEIEAETNKIRSEAIDDNIKFQMFIEKWDGKLPTYLSDSDLMNFLMPVGEE